MTLPAEKHLFRGRVNYGIQNIVMGDKSPKANQKKTGQKQTQASTASAKKSAVVASKQVAAKKK